MFKQLGCRVVAGARCAGRASAPAPAAPATGHSRAAAVSPPTICGQQPAPLAQPPAGSAPVVYLIAPCFEAQGGTSLVDSQTYVYYMQLKSRAARRRASGSRTTRTPSRSCARTSSADGAPNFLDNLSIETEDYTFPNGTIGKIVLYNMEERERIKIGPTSRAARSSSSRRSTRRSGDERAKSGSTPSSIRRSSARSRASSAT